MIANLRSESDVRKWVREQFPNEATWVEHSSGGTVGFPDCVLAIDGRLWLIELKFGSMAAGYWLGELRPAQVRVGTTLLRNGVEMFILVGSEFEKVLWMTSFSNYFSGHGTEDGTKMEPVSWRDDVVRELNKFKID
jgi:hypothetical protein